MMVARKGWILRDHTTDPVDEYNWAINPNSFELPYEKTVDSKPTCAPDGRMVTFEGRPPPIQMSFEGLILTEDQYNKMIHFFNKRTQIEMVDDLDRSFYIYITEFALERARSTRHPWRHRYRGSMVILDWDWT